MAKNIREPMEQGFGADFSRVKVHTDTQADQLNRSIQAKAFTTEQDVFFRQGAYEPGSRGGQELIAHELTHVVQQNGGAVHREKLQDESEAKEIRKQEQSSELSYSPRTVTSNRRLIQRTIPELNGLNKTKLSKKNEEIYNQINAAVDGRVGKNDVFKEIDELKKSTQEYTIDQVVETVIENKNYKKKVPEETQDFARVYKLQQIAPYIAMLPHMAGEEKDGEVQGGHLFRDMEDKWKDKLEYKKLSGDENGLWNMEWRIKENQNWKTSSMFPQNWTNENLRTALTNSDVISGKLELPNGTEPIKIEKAGKTFYPVK
ncbi:eCIS core domain-containing protein [Nostoc sp.]|uniref:eCIS core domain-containing protein n=1 Tax=Nostoc sp. TaxID=1180 RepID=UPI002FF9CF5F